MSNSATPVLHLVPSLEIGGMERMVASLALQSPITERVLCLEAYGRLGHQLREQGIDVECLRPSRNRAHALLQLRRHVLDRRVRILHAHNLKAFTYAAAVMPIAKQIRLVFTKHGMRLPRRSGLGERVRRLAARHCALVGVSQEICRQLQDWTNVQADRVTLIENGTTWQAPSASREVLRSQLGLSPETFAIACVARLALEKDHATLFQALKRILTRIDQRRLPLKPRLLLAGEGPLRDVLRSLADRMSVADSIVFLGERGDVPDIFAASDVAVLSSRTEGLPLTLLEAMMQHTPIVATAVGDIPNLIQNDAGKLVPPESPAQLADAILEAMICKNQTVAMAKTAFERVQQHYSIDMTRQKYQSLYQQLLPTARATLQSR